MILLRRQSDAKPGEVLILAVFILDRLYNIGIGKFYFLNHPHLHLQNLKTFCLIITLKILNISTF